MRKLSKNHFETYSLMHREAKETLVVVSHLHNV